MNDNQIEYFLSHLYRKYYCFIYIYDAVSTALGDNMQGFRLSRLVTIGIITALPKECAAVRLMLEHAMVWKVPGQGAGLRYYLGEITAVDGGTHLVAVALLPDIGNNSAAISTTQLIQRVPSVRHLIMCGIAGGIPRPGKPEDDVRLGDIVVSNRNGVVQYDLIKKKPDGTTEHRHPPRPPGAELLEAVRHLQTDEELGLRPWEESLEFGYKVLRKNGYKMTNWLRPADDIDACGEPLHYPVDPERVTGFPRVFHGTIAASNILLKNSRYRDYLASHFGVKAIEMESSGVADATWITDRAGYLVVRGVCDYCDNRKGDAWHGAAALAAAAYVRALISSMPADTVREEKTSLGTFFGPCLDNSQVGRFRTKALSRPRAEHSYQRRISNASRTHIDLSRLPHSSGPFFGRSIELTKLDEALGNPDVGVALVTSFGGRGKSSLVAFWLHQKRALKISFMIGWSFYRQGTNDRDSADEFSEWLLSKFGHCNGNLPTSRWERGELLADYMRRKRGVLVLDGLEPLQDRSGRIRDDCLRGLLRGALAQNAGLIVVTSRLTVPDLVNSPGTAQIPLGPLDSDSGVQLLTSLAVVGSEHELTATIEEFNGHPLALRLLGGLLRERYRGDVRRRYEITTLYDYPSPESNHAERVLRAYEQWFAEGPEHAFLCLLGLFEQPCNIDEIETLLNITEARQRLILSVPSVSSPSWNAMCVRLLELGLLTSSFDSKTRLLDTHPLIREHFGARMKAQDPELWRMAHNRLFEHYSSSCAELPETLSGGLADLYSAVRHGCKAEKYSQAFELYWNRILRGFEYFSTYKICAFTLELSALSGFFEEPWHKMAGHLSLQDSARIHSQVGYCLRAIGSLEEALYPFRESSASFEKLHQFLEAAISEGNYARTLLPLGRLVAAERAARHAVELADKAGIAEERADKRTVLADVLHQLGRFKEAESMFIKAEALLERNLPSFAGARYCEFLLNAGRLPEARTRALDIKGQADGGERAYLLFGLAGVYAAAASNPDLGLREADDAIQALRRSGRQDYLAHGLSIRSRIARCAGHIGRAKLDIEEALELVRRYNLDLYLV